MLACLPVWPHLAFLLFFFFMFPFLFAALHDHQHLQELLWLFKMSALVVIFIPSVCTAVFAVATDL